MAKRNLTVSKSSKAVAKHEASSDKAKVLSHANFQYKFSDDYNPVYANGAFGGITTQGEIVLNFYFERQPVPLSETRKIMSDTRLGDVTDQLPQVEAGFLKAVRFIENGTILSLDTAKRIHEFLGKQIEELENLKKARAT